MLDRGKSTCTSGDGHHRIAPSRIPARERDGDGPGRPAQRAVDLGSGPHTASATSASAVKVFTCVSVVNTR